MKSSKTNILPKNNVAADWNDIALLENVMKKSFDAQIQARGETTSKHKPAQKLNRNTSSQIL